MKAFNIYKHPTQGIEAVKVGFSWPALFFGVIWMLVKKLWGRAGAWFAMYLALVLIEKIADQSGRGGAQAFAYLLLAAGYFALWLIPAFKGNKWREENLTNRGYEQHSTAQAITHEAAVAQTVSTMAAHYRSNNESSMPVAGNTTMPSTPPVPTTTVDEDLIYAQIADELESGNKDKGLWTRIFAECGGDENGTKALYIKRRAERLIAAERLRLEQAKVFRDKAAEAKQLEELHIQSLKKEEEIAPDLLAPQPTTINMSSVGQLQGERQQNDESAGWVLIAIVVGLALLTAALMQVK